jgi:hypothetical protein
METPPTAVVTTTRVARTRHRLLNVPFTPPGNKEPATDLTVHDPHSARIRRGFRAEDSRGSDRSSTDGNGGRNQDVRGRRGAHDGIDDDAARGMRRLSERRLRHAAHVLGPDRRKDRSRFRGLPVHPGGVRVARGSPRRSERANPSGVSGQVRVQTEHPKPRRRSQRGTGPEPGALLSRTLEVSESEPARVREVSASGRASFVRRPTGAPTPP